MYPKYAEYTYTAHRLIAVCLLTEKLPPSTNLSFSFGLAYTLCMGNGDKMGTPKLTRSKPAAKKNFLLQKWFRNRL